LWKDKPFSKQAAWIDMLLLANHDDNKFMLGNELVEVKCGSFISSIEKLKSRWGWSNTKVVSFLKLLESDEMIVKKSDTKKTVITIVKYGD
jgi:DNA replication protein DnaD